MIGNSQSFLALSIMRIKYVNTSVMKSVVALTVEDVLNDMHRYFRSEHGSHVVWDIKRRIMGKKT